MTDSLPNPSENKIEADYPSVPSPEMLLSQRMDKLSERMDSLDRRVERMEILIEKVVRQISILVDHQHAVIDSQKGMSHNMERLTGELLPKLTDKHVSTYAAMERFERVLDYLLRCNGK